MIKQINHDCDYYLQLHFNKSNPGNVKIKQGLKNSNNNNNNNNNDNNNNSNSNKKKQQQ